MAEKKPKTIKKVTEIPNASVKIEVEETEDKENSTVEETTEEVSAESISEENSPTNDDSESSDGLNWRKVILIILIVVPIGFLIFGGFLYFSKNLDINKIIKKAPEKSIELPETSPTPTKEQVNKEAYVIDVQNGSGIAGEGARVKATLDAAGFKTGTVGNADNSDYTDTIIKVSTKVTDGFIDELTKVLEERGAVGKVEKIVVGQDGDVIVIIGSDVVSVTPSMSPSKSPTSSPSPTP